MSHTEAHIIPPHETAVVKEAREDREEIKDLRAALLAACNYIENATPNLGRKASENYSRAAAIYRKIAAGEMRFSDLRD